MNNKHIKPMLLVPVKYQGRKFDENQLFRLNLNNGISCTVGVPFVYKSIYL